MSEYKFVILSITKDFKDTFQEFIELMEYDNDFISYINDKKIKDKRFKDKKMWNSAKIRIGIEQWMKQNAKRVIELQELKRATNIAKKKNE